jgi:hypothetical protein
MVKKMCKKAKLCQKIVEKLSKIVKKLPKSCQRIVTKLSKNWLGMEKVSFGLTGAAWNGGSRFGPV